MGRLTDLFGKPADDQFKKFLATSTDAAKPVPHGEYRCRVAKGEHHTAGSGNSGYRLTFTIQDGEHAGRKLWQTRFFTDAARETSRRELAKFGLVVETDFTAPFPGDKVIDCTVFVAVTTSERGEVNDVQRVAGIVIQSPSAGTGRAKAARMKPPTAKGAPRRKAAQKKPAGGEGANSPTQARAKTAGPKKSAGAKGKTPQRTAARASATGRKGGGK